MFQLNESILNGAFIFSILQAVLFALLFLTKKNKSLPDLIIGIWLFLLAIQTILIFCVHNRLISGFNHLPIIITLLYGPMQFLYVTKICSGEMKIRFHELVHFLPFLFFLIAFFTYRTTGVYIKILAGTSSLSGLAYCIFTLHTLRKHLLNIKNHFSFTDKVNLAWVNKLVLGLILIWFGVAIVVFLRRIFNYNLSLDLLFLVIPLFIFYIGFHGIKQQVIFSFYSDVPQPGNSSENPEKVIPGNEAYKNSGLRENQMKAIYEKLIHAMESEKLFLNPALNLQELSDKLKIPPHHITQTLNEFGKQNFYDFVNTYRVNEFRKRVDRGDAESFSLLGIAFDCGFNSKSSFNRVFKNIAGVTPSGYKVRQS